ncbi:MAG: hypothetical protein ACREQ9_03175, partial [Candidatus Binatia bacterium]
MGYDHISTGLRRRVDTIARRLISLAGVGIILSIGAIFVFIALEAYPLLLPAKAVPIRPFPLAGADPALVVASDEYRENLLVLRESGVLQVMPSAGGAPSAEVPLAPSGRVTAAAYHRPRGELAMALDTGEIRFVRAEFVATFEGSRRVIRLESKDEGGRASLDEGFVARRLAYARGGSGDRVLVAWDPEDGLRILRRTETETPLGELRSEESVTDLTKDLPGRLTSLALSSNGIRLVAGFEDGMLHRWDLGAAEPRHVESVRATAGSDVSVTALGFLIGDRTLVVGDSSGAVSTWLSVRAPQAPDGWRTTLVHPLRA